MPDDVWEYREPGERDPHPQTEARATRWHGEQYRQSEHLRRLNGPQAAAPRRQPPGYEHTGPLQASPPQYTPPKHASWVSAHKAVTAVLSVCALTVAGAGVFALLPSGPGSPGPSTAAAAGVTVSSRAQDQRAGSTAASQPAAAVTVTGTGATASAAAKVKAAPRATVPSAKAGPSAHPTAAGASTGTVAGTAPGTPPVTVTTYRHTTPIVPPSSPPPVSPPPPTSGCTVSGSKPAVTAVIPAAAAGPVGAVINVVEIQQVSATQNARAEIHVPGPLTAGETVSVTGAANPLMTSCEVGGVVSAAG